MTTNADLTTWINAHVASPCDACSPGRFELNGSSGSLFMYVEGAVAKWATLTPGTDLVAASGTMADQAACDTVLTANGL